MSILAIISGLLKLTNALTSWAERNQLMAAGEANAVRKQNELTLNAVAKASAARRAVKHDPDSVRSDEFNRDKD